MWSLKKFLSARRAAKEAADAAGEAAGRTAPADPDAADSLFRKTCALSDLTAAVAAPPTLPPVTENFARMRLACAEVQRGLASGTITNWAAFEGALDAVGIDHLLIAGENAKGEPVWTSWLRNRKTGEIVACVSVYKTFTMRGLVKLLGPHPKWNRSSAPAAGRRKGAGAAGPKFIVMADDTVLVEQNGVRVAAGIGIAELPAGSHDLDLGEAGGTVMIHPDGARVYYDRDRRPIRVVGGREAPASNPATAVAAAG